METWWKKYFKGDPVIWVIVILLYFLSALVVYSSVAGIAFKHHGGYAEVYLFKHLGHIALSVFVMWIFSKLSYRYYSKIASIGLFSSWILLIYALSFGLTVNNASSWVKIGGVSFQPSDLAKFCLLIVVSHRLANRQKVVEEFGVTLAPLLFIFVAPTFLLIAVSDIGSAAALIITVFVLFFIGRIPFKQLVATSFLGILALVLALLVGFGQRAGTAINRVKDWWNSIANGAEHEIAYQLEHAYIAIARGGFWGVGPGNSQERYMLPEGFSDFIFAILIEEHGLKIGVVVIFLYVALLYRAMKIASRSDKTFGGLLATGIAFSFAMQAIINMMVVVGLIPVTGLTLPFLSMGGTSLLFSGMSMGILLSISRTDVNEPEIPNFNAPKQE